MADKKTKWPDCYESFLKRAQEKQSESLSKPCAITIYSEGTVPLLKPQDNTFKAAVRDKRVTFYFAREKHIKLK